ncbi:MAG: LytTR family transcriptional regulator DNA-binding domain-containing protein [Lachnospiraceae bacterium]|nr:LytTR family transcriptional regulator DNA-binding domain-containing protein [Lachnospiraceae bacterium]
MNIITRQVEEQPLTIIIEYPKYNEFVSGVVKTIKSIDMEFSASDDDKQIRIPLSEIYYFEIVERKIFIYTQKEVYRLALTTTELEDITKGSDIVRISRTCLINIQHLKGIKQIRNSHLEAELDNSEKLIVSRKYLKDIKQRF